LREVLDRLRDGRFSKGARNFFEPMVNELMSTDRYFVPADSDAYVAAQQLAGEAYAAVSRWGTMSLLNTTHSGKRSSDYTVREYCEDIWKLPIGTK
jgi:starch phosphorylase